MFYKKSMRQKRTMRQKRSFYKRRMNRRKQYTKKKGGVFKQIKNKRKKSKEREFNEQYDILFPRGRWERNINYYLDKNPRH